jgi:PrtD family type I secretion system ABC transporter
MSQKSSVKKGLDEIKAARKVNRPAFWFIFVFSFFMNILMLTSPFYMLQVYDRVLSSRSIETLVALSLLVAFLYLMMGLLDYVRGRVLVRIGTRFFNTLAPRVFTAVQDKTAAGFADDTTKVGLRDLEAMQKSLASPITSAFFDVPWIPVFIGAIALFHPLLGLFAVVGGTILVVFALLNQFASKDAVDTANMMSSTSHLLADGLRDNAEVVQGMGMKNAAYAKWQTVRNMAVDSELRAADLTGGFSASTKAFRMALQSGILGLGAYLVLTEGLTPGVMIASSIIMGRALAPIETLLGQWPLYQRAAQGRERLAQMLTDTPKPTEPMDLGRPAAKIVVKQLAIVPPAPPPNTNKPTLRGVDFQLNPGQALGVIGASGSGKSSLARALIGVWHPAAGKIELDGASYNQYGSNRLGAYIGYLPQQVTLFDGTLSENIARMSAMPDPEAVIVAAKKAAVHEMILQLPQGYETPVKVAGTRLSGGQLQRIGLARAFYGDPVLLVLDEPNSNLDNEGSIALNHAIATAKTAGYAVIIMAHRPAAIQLCDLILVLENGQQRAFGPRDEVLRETVQNHETLRAPAKAPQQAAAQAAAGQTGAQAPAKAAPTQPAQSAAPAKASTPSKNAAAE